MTHKEMTEKSKNNILLGGLKLYATIGFSGTSFLDLEEDMLKNVGQLVYSRHRSVHNFLKNMLAAIGAYCFFSIKPEVNIDFKIPETNGQLVLWQ